MTIVSISNGAIRGSTEDGIHAFKGIPYAEPVSGAARWLPSQPRRDWQGVFDARDYGPACMQFGGSVDRSPFPAARRRYLEALGATTPLREGDDCLLLNVWSPSLDAGARLPVMVFLHGGGFSTGAACAVYDATPFARKDVVAVVIQYRLGPPGFLHGSGLFDDELCTDNRGLLDQIAALRWVQDNIAAFGGDPGTVTLFGESAGAFAIYQLAASPLAKGLFRRCIAMGGMAGTCAPARDYHALTRDVLQTAGVAPGDGAALAALDKPQMMKLQSAVSSRIFKARDPNAYGRLSRERVGFMGAATETLFLPRSPLETYPSGTPNDIDLLLGTCASDGQLFSLMFPVWQSLSARLFSGALKGIVPDGDLPAVRRFYRQQLRGAEQALLHEQINNDAFYRMPTLQAAEAHAQGHPGRTYHYQLDYQSVIPGIRAVHGIDVALLFRSEPVIRLLADDAETAQLSAIMVEAFTSFARTGKPEAAGMPDWLPFDPVSRPTMVLDRACRLESDLDGHLCRYWSPPAATAVSGRSSKRQAS